MSDQSLLAELTVLATRELELCAVDETQTVLIVSTVDTHALMGAALLAASQSLGAECVEAVLPAVGVASVGGVPRRTSVPKSLIKWCADADLLVDVTARGMLHSSTQAELLATGTRILRAREPVDCLARLFPTPEVRASVERSGQILGDGDKVRITSEHGTDVTLVTGDRPISLQYGYSADRGRWDHWGTALVVTAPLENSAVGDLVLSPGDVIFLSATIGRYVAEPVTLHLAGGAIASVEGGAEKALIEELLIHKDDEQARHTSHVGWGCDPRADWYALERYAGKGGGGADVRSASGGVVLAFGANTDLGGVNSTSRHVDLALRGLSVEVAGVRPVVAGSLNLE
ncbi:MAG: hypothetical protein WAM97_15460 [Acidimicrobiales bacterium]